jgi:hypothetical protein
LYPAWAIPVNYWQSGTFISTEKRAVEKDIKDRKVSFPIAIFE